MARPLDSDAALMEYADGEASEAERGELALRVDADAGARGKVDAVHELGELVRGDLEHHADAVPASRFDAMWSAIDAQLGEAAAPAAAPKLPESRSFGARLAAWFDRYRGYIVTGAVSAGAVAALALVLRPASRDDASGHSDAIDVRPVALRSPPEIEALDTPGGSPTVINYEDEDGHTTMIWVTPADTVEGI